MLQGESVCLLQAQVSFTMVFVSWASKREPAQTQPSSDSSDRKATNQSWFHFLPLLHFFPFCFLQVWILFTLQFKFYLFFFSQLCHFPALNYCFNSQLFSHTLSTLLSVLISMYSLAFYARSLEEGEIKISCSCSVLLFSHQQHFSLLLSPADLPTPPKHIVCCVSSSCILSPSFIQ